MTSARKRGNEPVAITLPAGARADKSLLGKTFPVLLLIALITLLLFSLTLGRYPVPLLDVARIVSTTPPFGAIGDYANAPWVVVEIVRMPRILLVTLCGMGLAMSGAATQGVFRNPLVGPEIVGVSSGASLGGVIGIMFSWPPLAVVGLAFGCGLAGVGLAFALARATGRSSSVGLVLSGVIVSGFCGALVGLLQTLADPVTKLPSILYWLLGSFAGATYDKVAIVAGVSLVAGTLLLSLRWRINLLSLGEMDAAALGVDVEALRWAILGLVALIVAAQVSVSGGVGWVGLIVPHLARMLVGPEHSRLLPITALLGGFYLLAMDDIARSLTEQEIPIGLLTSVVGTPIFAFLFWKTQSRGWINE
ncbi:iron chelate uptake ABC transporter family permease subunit [Methylocystis heyeri]|uniref:Iron chelate uptake ABC transporter family permease subunit n=1 Tax=Methylocystis heyeri TaxID=391905 RepID=A0A6B8K7V6_9HYPH|nr:iron chelate uptake ABC transporter family permease subunit [Methylocystis heyeri]